MKQFDFATDSVLRSMSARPVRFMEENGYDEVIYFIIRGGSDELRQRLVKYLGWTLLARIPLKRARREMYICRVMPDFSDADNLYCYRQTIEQFFGTNSRVRVHIVKGGYNG